MKKRFCGAVAAFVVLIGCANGDGPTVEPPDTDADLASLFAAPTAAEIAAVEADWSQRNPVAADIRLEREGGITSGTRASNLQVVSYKRRSRKRKYTSRSYERNGEFQRS